MQNSQRFRRGMVLPISDEAEEDLRIGDVSINTAVRFLPILNDALFDSLWNRGLFTEINKQCCASIDDYEEWFVEPSSLDGAAIAVKIIAQKDGAVRSDVAQLLNDLNSMISEARSLSRPILFVL